MNFFEYDEHHGRHLVIAKNAWIYIAVWVPLTVLTYLFYRLMESYHKPQHKPTRPWPNGNGVHLEGP